MARLGVIPPPVSKAPPILPLFPWEFGPGLRVQGCNNRAGRPGQELSVWNKNKAAPKCKVKADRILCSECMECCCSQSQGRGRDPPSHSVPAGRTALAAPDPSMTDGGNSARVQDPAQGKHCPSPALSLH